MSRAALALLAALGLAGCVTHVPLSAEYTGPTSLPGALLEEVPADSDPLVVRAERELRERARFEVLSVTLAPSAENEVPIEFEYYDVSAPGPTPVVVLLPIFNGQDMIPNYFARYFANQGWAAVVVTRERDPLDELDDPDAAIRANLADYRRVLDWVEQQPELDGQRIGLFGVSLGAMDAVMLTALDGRVDALVVAMAGGDLGYLLAHTNYARVVRRVDRMLLDLDVSRAALGEQLAARITLDPLRLAPYVDAERVLMIITRTDAIIPVEAQEALRAKLGAPETLYLPTGHRPSVIYFPLLRTTAYDFLAKQFEGAAPAAPRGDGSRQAEALRPRGVASRFATSAPIASDAVRPGDSIPSS